jgi:hypothetical protein
MPSWWDWNAFGAIGQWLAAIATFAAVIVALRAEHRARSTHLTVRVALGPTPAGRGGPAFIISVVNPSNRHVILEGGSILLSDRSRLGPIADPGLTGEMRELERRDCRVSAATVAQWLIAARLTQPTKLWFCIHDSSGKQHGGMYKFDPHPWLQKSPKPADTHPAPD